MHVKFGPRQKEEPAVPESIHIMSDIDCVLLTCVFVCTRPEHALLCIKVVLGLFRLTWTLREVLLPAISKLWPPQLLDANNFKCLWSLVFTVTTGMLLIGEYMI